MTKGYAQRYPSLSCERLRQSGCLLCKCCYESLRYHGPFTYAPHLHTLDRTCWGVCTAVASMSKTKVYMSMCMCLHASMCIHIYSMCVCVCVSEDVSEYKRWFWGFACAMSEWSASHVLDQRSCADGFHVLMQPSGLSDTEWHCAPFPDLCVKRKMERWVEKEEVRWRKAGGKGGNKNKTNVNHCWAAGRRGWWREDKRLMESRGSSERWRDLCLAVRWIGWTWAAC